MVVCVVSTASVTKVSGSSMAPYQLHLLETYRLSMVITTRGQVQWAALVGAAMTAHPDPPCLRR